MNSLQDYTLREKRFMEIITAHRNMISKICYMYANDDSHYKDLYQEVLANLWQGLGSYRGDSKISTWIYRASINTCISFFRKYDRHSSENLPLDSAIEVSADDTSNIEELKQMYRMISALGKLDKAIILMWLDEYSYDDIAEMTGITRSNVAIRLRRIKLRLIEQAKKSEI
ncbi:MAG: sigma-70 family RNA polymerase sigma factor [Lachnoclostridium sp.]|nr:sigma-70 family RNA polymerase sigma factor [Lachnoclostridium sp.]